MPQVINTNVPSLLAQNKLDKATARLGTSFERLSSGLRINSAKDDAAGLAIATRFSSTISGLTVAKRNANDAISLAQVAEGALEEVTSMLQRCRELSEQSANGTNSSTDRAALQAEVNQLKEEMQRTATTTTFNGNNILNGNLKNAQFQVGSEANQIVTMSIQTIETTAIGTNELVTNNSNGIEAATHSQFLGNGFASGAAGLGAKVGLQQAGAAAASLTGFGAETLTISHVDTAGVAATATAGIAANIDAKTIATSLSAVAGVTATAFNKITLSNIGTTTAFGATAAVDLRINGGGDNTTLANVLIAGSTSDTAATAINASGTMQALGVYAVSRNNTLDIYATKGHSLILEAKTTAQVTDVGTFDVVSAFNAGDSKTITLHTGTASSYTRAGRVDVQLNQGYTISSSLTAANSILGGAAGGLANTALVTTNVGLADVAGGNAVAAQTLSISGSASATVNIDANEAADSIATKINNKSSTTNVNAKANTTVSLSNLKIDGANSTGGSVSFNLTGMNTTSTPISASITSNDFSALKTAINNMSGVTDIRAEFDPALGNAGLILSNSTGKDIKITDFSAGGVQYQNQNLTISPVAGTGSAVAVAKVATLDVKGNVSTNSTVANGVSTFNGKTVTLSSGGTAINAGHDSAVVGGHLSLTSSGVLSVTSSVNGTSNPGSLFGVAANSGTNSTLKTVNEVDISTIEGANSAISVLGEAMNQVSSIRANLGAVQSRFSSAIGNLTNNISNLNIALSRILDTDFAAETASLSKQQILQSAGMAVLSQANQLPQNVMQLLK